MTTLRDTGPARPRQPSGFGSYAPEEVTFLVKDLGDLRLEVPSDEYEVRVGRGRRWRSAAPRPRGWRCSTGCSPARRAGSPWPSAWPPRPCSPTTPGRRCWALWRRGLALPHYTISMVRGRGVDANALAHVRGRHPGAGVQLVDGWTGKGAITRELGPTPAAAGVAVLADPAGCAPIAGTREDLLVPNACLNATVSGLVSRTVVVPGLIGPDDFHGAKFYRGRRARRRPAAGQAPAGPGRAPRPDLAATPPSA